MDPKDKLPSRTASPSPSLSSASSNNSTARRLGSLQPELPAPGRLASVRTIPTGHYFLPTSSRVTLRGTQKMRFVPTGQSHGSIGRMGRVGMRDRSRFVTEMKASGPFAYGPHAMMTGSNKILGHSMMDEKKDYDDFAEDFDSFREDPWAPDILTIEKDESFQKFLDAKNELLSKEIDQSREINLKEKKEIASLLKENGHLFCIQLPSILPKFEANTLPVSEIFDELGDKDNSNTEGQIGKLVIRSSGQMQMIIGNFVFDVNPGLDRSFLENSIVIDPSKETVYNLGQIKKHLVVKPNISDLLV
ncbi:9109_t:CDS:2 [Entrophospora sp. SA101]|nr:8970_t:CDS:2 [Entrophospora sp. SA101]CAJ0760259.1 9109_t:CDS:2 [Entrophospora sp. SA101]